MNQTGRGEVIERVRSNISKVLAVAVVAVAGLAALSAATPQSVRAEEKVHPLQWLRTQPLTLFDWGLWRLERNISRVGRWLEDAEALDDPPITGVEWHWRRQNITLFVSLARRPGLRTGAYCKRLYVLVRRKLLGSDGPTGPGRASWYVRSVFFPQGREWTRPTKDFAERLVGYVHLQIVMLGHPSEGLRLRAPKITCTAKLESEEPVVRKQAVN